VHEATVAHYVCPEHGELMDVPGGPVDEPGERALATETRLAHNERAIPREHRHCLLVPQRLQPATSAHDGDADAKADNVVVAAVAPPTTPLPHTDLVLLAPKTSPPL
jgi:hypothetical protein